MSFSFRIRFNRPKTKAFLLKDAALTFSEPGERLSLLLLASGDLSLNEALQMALIGSGYGTAEEAELAGRQFQNALMIALARVRLGADFGLRTPTSAFLTSYGLELLSKQIGQPVLNDEHGLMVFPSKPDPRFQYLDPEITLGADSGEFVAAFKKSIALQPQITDRDLFAYTIFNASFFQPSADARFLLLIMAIEALLVPLPRSNEGQAHVHSLIEQTKSASLACDEIESMIGSLRWLLHESINKAGQRLATERLGNKVYADKIAADFFKYCYQLRSRLVHGIMPAPTVAEIRIVVPHLEVFVSDLLTVPILG